MREDTKSETKRILLKDIDIPDMLPPAYMTDSVEALGTLEDVKLMKRSGKYEIIDGRRRLATMKQQGIESTEAKVFTGLKPAQIAIMTLVANYARSHNLISELEALKELESKKVDEDTLRKYMNVTKNKVHQLRRLADLPENLYKALAENRISESIAKAVAVMNKKQQKKLSKIYDTNGKLTANDLKELKDQAKQDLAANMDESLFVVPDQVSRVVKEIQDMPDGNKVRLWRELAKLKIIKNQSFVEVALR
jgi:ParB/RepB/Spo0J family partition protein